jgi:hypothetical protein
MGASGNTGLPHTQPYNINLKNYKNELKLNKIK